MTALHHPFLVTALVTFLTPMPSHAEITFSEDLSDLTPAERAWMEDDSSLNSFAVNEGSLTWLEPFAIKPHYTMENHLTILPSSLKDGWVAFRQCHHHLDAISSIEITYTPESTRNLKLLEFSGMENAELKASSVALHKVSSGAKVCVSGENLTLHSTTSGWKLERGPYMRRFLHGYYPMHLQETLNWQQTDLQLQPSSVTNHKGRLSSLNTQHNQLTTDYWFEGVLRTHYEFKSY